MTTQRRRGSTLIEVMVASLILITGMTGIIALIIKGMSSHREANVQLQAQNLSNSIASQYATLPYTALKPLGGTTVNTGNRTDEDGRQYPTTAKFDEVGDGGVSALRIEVHTVWTNFLRLPVQEVAVTIVSDIPDANF
jgi:type II secretory pathway pseudopilin PulG